MQGWGDYISMKEERKWAINKKGLDYGGLDYGTLLVDDYKNSKLLCFIKFIVSLWE